jgi:hypothetical protein
MSKTEDPSSNKSLEHNHSGDLEVRDEAIGTFRDLIQTSFDPRDVDKWVRASRIRQNLFDDLAVGRIRWPRSLGRPDAPSLSEGFVIRTKFWVDVWHIGLDGSIIVDLQGWMPGILPDLRDGFSEPDHYSVRYLFHAPVENDDEVEVQFSDVPWHHPVRAVQPQPLYLSSHGYQFHSDGTFFTLPDITVDSRPFFHP